MASSGPPPISASPMIPVAPPSKKIRAHGGSSNSSIGSMGSRSRIGKGLLSSEKVRGGKDRLSQEADDAITKRRLELRRLQQMRSGEKKHGENVLAMARSQLGSGTKSTSTHRTKTTSSFATTTASSFTTTDTTSTLKYPLSYPSSEDAPVLSSEASPTPIASPTPAVARRLDISFSKSRPTTPGPPARPSSRTPSAGRAKSAPGSRGHPTPPPRKTPTSTTKNSSNGDVRSYISRPEPMKPSDFPVSSPNGSSPQKSSTSNRDTLNNLRMFAETPPQNRNNFINSIDDNATVLLQMQEKIIKQEKSKTEALRKVARLEGEMQQLRESAKSMNSPELETLVHLAQTKGETKAISWAKERVSGSASQPQVGFFSPPRNFSAALTPRSMPRKRVTTPHPKRSQVSSENKRKKNSSEDYRGENGLVNEGEQQQMEKQATASVPHEYTIDGLATLVIRRLYGFADKDLKERELWVDVGQFSPRLYENSSNIGKPSTLEVCAKIETDGSILTLFGESSVKHKANGDNEWKEFGNVDDLEKPLGSVLYIDADANEKDYSLDDIFEGVIAAREHYCSSILSMTAALQDRQAKDDAEQRKRKEEAEEEAQEKAGIWMRQQQELQEALSKAQKEETPEKTQSDACVGTEDMAYKSDDANEDKGAKKEEIGEPKKKKKKKKAKSPPPDETEDDEGSSSDVLALMMGSFFSAIFWMIWTVLVRVPLRVFTFTLMTLIAYAAISLLWLLFADDHGAQDMGAAIDFMYNAPRHGIV